MKFGLHFLYRTSVHASEIGRAWQNIQHDFCLTSERNVFSRDSVKQVFNFRRQCNCKFSTPVSGALFAKAIPSVFSTVRLSRCFTVRRSVYFLKINLYWHSRKFSYIASIVIVGKQTSASFANRLTRQE